MKSTHRTRAASRELGLSLIELMVSITIGLILMIAISSAYMGSSSAGKLAEAQGRMNEDASAALSILAQQMRMAGDNPRRPMYAATTPHNAVFSPLGALTYAVRGCDGKFSDITSAATINDLTCAAGDNTNPDSVAIVYEADPYNTVAASGLATDCLGQTLPVVTNSAGSATPTLVFSGTTTVATDVTYTVADNRFYIQDDGTIPSLYCKGNGNATPQPMVENIEDMQFSWGMAAPLPATDMTVAGYLASANLVETNANLLAMPATDSALRWSRAAAVKICVLVRSEQPVVSDAASAKYSPCFADPANPLVDAPDLRLRRAYYSVVALRNRIQQ
jgi:type IV pilus assembly protein PilW